MKSELLTDIKSLDMLCTSSVFVWYGSATVKNCRAQYGSLCMQAPCMRYVVNPESIQCSFLMMTRPDLVGRCWSTHAHCTSFIHAFIRTPLCVHVKIRPHTSCCLVTRIPVSSPVHNHCILGQPHVLPKLPASSSSKINDQKIRSNTGKIGATRTAAVMSTQCFRSPLAPNGNKKWTGSRETEGECSRDKNEVNRTSDSWFILGILSWNSRDKSIRRCPVVDVSIIFPCTFRELVTTSARSAASSFKALSNNNVSVAVKLSWSATLAFRSDATATLVTKTLWFFDFKITP